MYKLTKCFHNVRVLPGQNVCCFWVSKRIYKSCLQEFVAFPMTLSNSVLLWAWDNNRTVHSKRNSIRCIQVVEMSSSWTFPAQYQASSCYEGSQPSRAEPS